MNLMLSRFLLISGLAVIAFAAGCNGVDNPALDVGQEQDLPAKLGSQFQLKVHQTAFTESENIRITFLDVTEDSRCPSDVICIWAGQAAILVNILKDDKNLGDFSLVSYAGNNKATETFDNYSIRLVKVDPYPISTQKIELSDYIITLVVTKLL